MKKLKLFFLFFVVGTLCLSAQNTHYQYETAQNDPFGVKVYTLENGLKIYMSVYKDEPRIQTQIVVRAGSKNDPASTTGLAHYLEHLMFKGTKSIGTTNWDEESVLLDEIESTFEKYRAETDPETRKAIYARIDSLSYVASGYAIPNEYVKLMKYIGSTGTNAWTSNDNTVYLENIPSNQLDNWARIQGDRFTNPVIRLFHTELETVYEEKNRSLTSDSRRANEQMLRMLFPNHPYGTQTTLGEAEHLKNPSISNIKRFIETYYAPNNMAIILAGDFDPDEAVRVIEKYFGHLEPHDIPAKLAVPNVVYKSSASGTSDAVVPPTKSTTTPKARSEEVHMDADGMAVLVGQEAEFVNVAYRVGLPASDKNICLLKMLDYVLSNGKCGLVDLNINQKQLTGGASAYPYILCDNSAYVFSAKPKSEQPVQEVVKLLTDQLQLVARGDFDDGLLVAALNNIKLQEMRQLESNSARASVMANSFMNGLPWKTACEYSNSYDKITKSDLQAFAQQLMQQPPIVVHKKRGAPQPIASVAKPAITPIQINRDAESDFFKELKRTPVESIQPVFVDYNKAIERGNVNDMSMYCVQNTENKTFTLQFVYPVGEMNIRELPVVLDYIKLLGDDKHTAEALHTAFYGLACNFSVHCGDYETVFTLSGLSDNFDPALKMMLHFAYNVQSDEDVFKNFIEDRIKAMEDAKGSQEKVLAALRTYVEYGSDIAKNTLRPDEMRSMDGVSALKHCKELFRFIPQVRYYGPLNSKQLGKYLKKYYEFPKTAEPTPEIQVAHHMQTGDPVVLYVPYEAKQARLATYSSGPQFDEFMLPIVTLYNRYFGGGMNAIVFQEMREKRSLAYTAQSSFVLPSYRDDIAYNYSFIGTQNDKVVDAWTAFNELFDSIPVSQVAFDLAKNNVKTSIATERITKGRILSSYFANKKRGMDYDYRQNIYNKIDGLTLQDVLDFNAKYIKGKSKVYLLLESQNALDKEAIEENFGPIKQLELKQIFGY